jgi:hypothetical protein
MARRGAVAGAVVGDAAGAVVGGGGAEAQDCSNASNGSTAAVTASARDRTRSA